MVMTSDQISALAGSFQVQTMNQMQHAAMLSQQLGHQSFGDAAMGRAVNFGASVGSPIGMGVAGLAGLDPFSMGIRGAMAGGARMGMMGAVGGGMLGAGLVGVPMMAAQYAGSQMMGGMQQQQMLNSSLGQQFQFNTGLGGGFSSGQMGSIGQMMRGMSMQKGPGGELTTMSELTNMASMMGQMGMGQGISSVKDFTEKFRSMMKEVKEVATAFHTSLQEAQQVVGSMRSSGIFQNQGQVAQQIRQNALAGGLATSEVTSMMGIGSQISRSIGGYGRAGAMGGMQAISQVGIAQRAGVMSEEDIYNVTGLTGAEGRQAMATRMMQTSANFLRGGLGRRFLASMAGKDGTLDEESVDAYMHGGAVGTGDTMNMAHKNLSKVGRANFIRNEGRLRGAALEKFGGLAPAMVMKQWLEQRGLDMNDDRSMIFAQRRLGLGNDEMEQMMKMVRNLPQLMQEREMSGFRDDRIGRLEEMRSRTGLSGIKKKFESARHEINSRLQQAGADFYQAGSNMIERWANQLTDNFMLEVSDNLEPAIQEILRGGDGAERALSRFGMGKGLAGQGSFGAAHQAVFGKRAGLGSLASARRAGDLGRLSNAGYGTTAGSDSQYESHLRTVRNIGMAFREGNSAVGGLGAENAAFFQEQVGMRGFGNGMQGQTDFGNILARATDPRLQKLALQYNQANETQRAAIMGTVMRDSGMGALGSASAIAGESKAMFDMGGFRTAADRNMALGGYMLGQSGANAEYRNEKFAFGQTRGDLLGGVAGNAARMASWLVPGGLAGEITGLNKSLGDEVSSRVSGRYNEAAGGISRGTKMAAGDYLMSEEGQRRIRGVLSSDSKMAAKADEGLMSRLGALMTRQAKLQGEGGNLSESEQGEVESLRALHLTKKFTELSAEHGEDRAAEMLAEEWGTSVDDVKAKTAGVRAAAFRDQANARRELYQRASAHGRQQSGVMRDAGLMQGGRLSGLAIGKYGQIGATQQVDVRSGMNAQLGAIVLGSEGLKYAQSGAGTAGMTAGQRWLAGKMGSASALERINEFSDDPNNEGLLRQHIAMQQDASQTLSGMSNTEVAALSKQVRSDGMIGASRELSQNLGLRRRLARAGGGVRGSIVMGEQLGSTLSRRELAGMGGNVDATARALGENLLGSSFETEGEGEGAQFYQKLRKALTAQKEGKTGEAATLMQSLQQSSVLSDARKNKQDESAEQDDPGFRRLGEIKNSLEALPEKLASSMKGMSVRVTNLEDLKKDPEKS